MTMRLNLKTNLLGLFVLGLLSLSVYGFAKAAEDAVAPVISNVQVSALAANSAVISWTTDELADSEVKYGLTANYTNTTEISENLPTSHQMTLTNLTPATLYHFKVVSADDFGNVAEGQDLTFTTLQSSSNVSSSSPSSTSTPISSTPPGLAMPLSLTQAENLPYKSGSLVNEAGTIYLIAGQIKIPFTNYAAFKGLGYSLSNVVAGDLSSYRLAQIYKITNAYEIHPWGSWLLSGKTVYYSTEQGLIPAPSWEVFLSNGGEAKFILPANQADLGILKAYPNLPLLQMNDSRVVR